MLKKLKKGLSLGKEIAVAVKRRSEKEIKKLVGARRISRRDGKRLLSKGIKEAKHSAARIEGVIIQEAKRLLSKAKPLARKAVSKARSKVKSTARKVLKKRRR